MTLKALPTPIETDRETYLPETLFNVRRHGHVWVEVAREDAFPGDAEHGGRWFLSRHVCRRCRRVAETMNRRTEPTVFTVRFGMHVPTACPKAGPLAKLRVALIDWMKP
jgi:hypothetical protein